MEQIDFSKAPALEVERFGPVVRGRAFYEEVIGPSCEADGWSAYLLYRDHVVRRDPWTIFEINLQTEKVTAFHGQKCDSWFLRLMPDGCIYTFPENTSSRPPKAYVARVNTKRGKLEIFGPGSPDSWDLLPELGP